MRAKCNPENFTYQDQNSVIGTVKFSTYKGRKESVLRKGEKKPYCPRGSTRDKTYIQARGGQKDGLSFHFMS